ncbi:MAG: DUF2508 family protein [Syntrophomonadaceae bacterium]|jgi:hypothetical protein|nr:DUF2508 family protein [Syntrophomonadaceae bacterium]
MVLGSNIWNKAYSLLNLKDSELRPEQERSDEHLLQQAHEELRQAQNWFAHLEEPDMVDYAIYKMKAAEKHYDYLLKKIKQRENQRTEESPSF